MPYYYDVNRALTSNGSANTESSHLYLKTIANQETASVKGLYAASRFATAGGAQLRGKTNTGTTVSGGTSQTPAPRNIRGSAAAQTTCFNDATAITAGTTLTTRITVGFAQTGGMGGWVALEPSASIQLPPNATSPVDFEVTSLASVASLTFDATVEFSEGV